MKKDNSYTVSTNGSMSSVLKYVPTKSAHTALSTTGHKEGGISVSKPY